MARPRPLSRHRFYGHLLLATLAVLVCFALPGRWARLSYVGYFVVIVLLCRALDRTSPTLPDWLYRGLGFACIAGQGLWLFTPTEHRLSGLPLLLAYTAFTGWSLVRLVGFLALERQVGVRVVAGALAGYLMLGLNGGLVLCVLETLVPGSFRGSLDLTLPVLSPVAPVLSRSPTWTVDFISINYFAFVSLTTVGYGDIVPVTPTAKIASILLSVAGPLYIAAVLGVLISRLTIQRGEEGERDGQELRQGESGPPDRS
jgi:voltage-gated potassium channel